MKELVVLSLFDGMSCGLTALKRAGIPVKAYYASEIDKYAIKVAQKNHPEIIQLGDVENWKSWDIESPDLIIGGSPCQGFSFAGKQLAFDDPRSKLFFTMMDIIEFYNPSFRLLENVRMKKDFLNIISEKIGVPPLFINSALISAQNRQRFYWFNWESELPEDKNIKLSDIVEKTNIFPKFIRSGRVVGRRINKKTGKRDDYNKTIPIRQYLEIKPDEKANCITTVAKDSVCIQMGEADLCTYDERRRVYSTAGKCPTLLTSTGGYHQKKITTDDGLTWRYLTPVEYERLQTLPDNYTEGVSNTQRYKMLGNGWTVDVIAHLFKELKKVL